MKVHYAFALAMLVAAGCQDHDNSTRSQSAKSGEISVSKGAALSAADKEFITMAASSGNFEVLSSELALTKPIDAKTKTFAQRMVKDHTAVAAELNTLAAKKNVAVPTKLVAKHQSMLDELRNASDSDFQKKYHDAQMAGHDEAIALFEKTAMSAQDPDIKAFASKNLPTLKEHKQMMH